MTEQTDIDINYEQMDDLPLCEHFEWPYFQMDELSISESPADQQIEWQAA